MKAPVLLNAILLAIFLALSSWVFLLSVGTQLRSPILLLLILGCSGFALGKALKNEGFAMMGWILIVSLSVCVQFFVLPVTYIWALASATAGLVLVDLVHFLGQVYPQDLATVSLGGREEWRRTSVLVTRHLVSTSGLAGISFLISAAVIGFSVPLEFPFNPVLGSAILATVALVLLTILTLRN